MQSTTTSLPQYEGWSNRPTWAVNLWLSNDHGLYEETRELVNDPSQYDNDAAERLEAFVREMVELDEASLRSDLLGWALAYVDWREIAQAWVEDETS